MGKVKHVISRAKWYAKMLLVFARISLLSQLEYRLNFIAFTAVELGYLVIKLIYLVIVIRSGVNIGPLTPDMVMMFVGVYIFMSGIWMLLNGVTDIPYKVVYGEMDMLMTKPGSLQFLQTFGKFNFGLTFPNVTAGIILICISWYRVEIPLTFVNIAGFIFFLLMGMLMTYSFILIPSLLVFWMTSLNSLGSLIISTWEFNNMPMEIYHKTARWIGTFVFPVFLLTNWPGMFVLRQLTGFQLIWGVAVPIALAFLSRVLWKKAFSRYSSANG